nr:MAG TPA: hypothetical protein [Crassvirales sp.]
MVGLFNLFIKWSISYIFLYTHNLSIIFVQKYIY